MVTKEIAKLSLPVIAFWKVIKYNTSYNCLQNIISSNAA